MIQYTVRGVEGGSEAALKQVAACGRFPVEHFTGDEHAGQIFQHKIFVERRKLYAARSGNGAGDRKWCANRQRNIFDERGEFVVV